MKIKLDNGAKVPTRAHELDAGYDLYARYSECVPAGGSALFDTGVHMEIPKGYVGFLKSKSGLNVKSGLLGEGVIDAGYTGSIVVKLYNHGTVDQYFNPGNKIAQIVLLPIFTPDLEVVDELTETERGENGFGSTGK